MTTAVEMSSRSGAGSEEQHNKEGEGGQQEVSLLLRRTTTTTDGIFLCHNMGRRTSTMMIVAIEATTDVQQQWPPLPDVSQFSVRYEYVLLARPAKARR